MTNEDLKKLATFDILLATKARIDKETNCWEYSGAKDQHGYGLLCRGYDKWRAHRLCWTLFFGEIKNNQWVLHKCNNPSCFNPNHLYLGNQKDNMADMARNKRQHLQKFTLDQIIEMRKRYNSGIPMWKIRKDFGAKWSNISAILNNKSWKHALEFSK